MLCSIAQKDVVFPRGQTVFRRLVWCGPSMLSAGAMDGVGGSFTRALSTVRHLRMMVLHGLCLGFLVVCFLSSPSGVPLESLEVEETVLACSDESPLSWSRMRMRVSLEGRLSLQPMGPEWHVALESVRAVSRLTEATVLANPLLQMVSSLAQKRKRLRTVQG